jgi:polar amino acid transport system ATP-binding protein
MASAKRNLSMVKLSSFLAMPKRIDPPANVEADPAPAPLPSVERHPMVAIEGLRKSFGPLEVLRGIDLSVRRGEVVCLLGPSGSGKSTLLRCINLLEQPAGGRISIDGQPVPYEKDRTKGGGRSQRALCDLRAQIGMVFQHFNLWPHMTVLGNVIEGLIQVKRMPRDQAAAIGEELLAKVGLREKINDRPTRLSGGQKQRVAIARALAMKPKLILFDEPTSALDPELIGEVLEVMSVLAREGMTMTVVTHEVGFAREIADRIVFMDNGLVVEEGPPGSVLEAPRHERTKKFLTRILRFS